MYRCTDDTIRYPQKLQHVAALLWRVPLHTNKPLQFSRRISDPGTDECSGYFWIEHPSMKSQKNPSNFRATIKSETKSTLSKNQHGLGRWYHGISWGLMANMIAARGRVIARLQAPNPFQDSWQPSSAAGSASGPWATGWWSHHCCGRPCCGPFLCSTIDLGPDSVGPMCILARMICSTSERCNFACILDMCKVAGMMHRHLCLITSAYAKEGF